MSDKNNIYKTIINIAIPIILQNLLISNLAEKNRDLTEETTSLSIEFVRITEKLNEIVIKFKTDDNSKEVKKYN